jgi:hypothetical protein
VTAAIAIVISVVAAVAAVGGVVIAAYAARQSQRASDAAERALQWQQERDAESRQTHVEVAVDHVLVDRIQYVWDLRESRPPPKLYELVIRVTNHGERTEYVTRLCLDSASGDDGTDVSIWLDLEPGGSGARPLAPREQVSATGPLSELDFDPTETGFVAVVYLSSGQEATSETIWVDDSLLAALDEHNRRARP